MTNLRLLLVAFAVGAVAAACAWWLVQDQNALSASQGVEQVGSSEIATSPVIIPSESIAASVPVVQDAESSTPIPDDGISDVERDEYAYQFATQPALIDALEDSLDSDPAVREDAERLLHAIVEPDPSGAPSPAQ